MKRPTPYATSRAGWQQRGHVFPLRSGVKRAPWPMVGAERDRAIIVVMFPNPTARLRRRASSLDGNPNANTLSGTGQRSLLRRIIDQVAVLNTPHPIRITPKRHNAAPSPHSGFARERNRRGADRGRQYPFRKMLYAVNAGSNSVHWHPPKPAGSLPARSALIPTRTTRRYLHSALTVAGCTSSMAIRDTGPTQAWYGNLAFVQYITFPRQCGRVRPAAGATTSINSSWSTQSLVSARVPALTASRDLTARVAAQHRYSPEAVRIGPGIMNFLHSKINKPITTS